MFKVVNANKNYFVLKKLHEFYFLKFKFAKDEFN